MKWSGKSLPTLLLAAVCLTSACALHRPVEREQLSGLGHFEFREASWGREGVVIGAPHGRTDRNSDTLAKTISDQTGAGLAIAYGFRSKRVSVSEPIVRPQPLPASRGLPQRGSVFKEYRKILRRAAKGEIELYIGVHRSTKREVQGRIEVASSGLTFEEGMALQEAYVRIRDTELVSEVLPKLEMAIEPVAKISWQVSGVKHHGALLIAEKGLNIRLPWFSRSGPEEKLYARILSLWADEAIVILRQNPMGLPQVQVQLMDLGRFERIESRKQLPGVVIGSPHGSYDEFTAEVVKRLSYRTGFAAVIAKGFTPTETGGARINVNRPTEKIPYSDGRDFRSGRASGVYRAFRDIVFEAAKGDLELYIDVHQYGTDDKIQVATVGISPREARIIKKIYHAIRDETLKRQSGVQPVDLVIEPVDHVDIGAWTAKSEGILSLAKKSLHLELPSEQALHTVEAREVYSRILAAFLRQSAPVLLAGSGDSPER